MSPSIAGRPLSPGLMPGLVAVLFVVAGGVAKAQGLHRPEIETFLTRYCVACHGGEAPDGGLNLQTFSRELTEVATLAKWVRTFDRVTTREMPPPDSDQPPDRERQMFTAALERDLTAAHTAQKGTVLRRLNRREYENTLNDLFGTNIELAETLPEDGRAHEFDTVGEALGLSLVQLQRYLSGIDAVLDSAIVQTLAPPERKTIRASYAETRGAEQFLGNQWHKLDDGAVVFYRQWGYPTGMLREANVQQDGWYTIRVRGYAHQTDRPITFALGGTTFDRGLKQPTFGYFELPPGDPTTIETRAYIRNRYMIDVTPIGINDDRNEIKQQGIAAYRGPGLAVNWVEVEGPLVDEFPSRGHRLVFDGLDRRELMPRNPQDRERPWYKPKFEVASSTPEQDVAAVLQRVATAAFRRPATQTQIEPYRALFHSELSGGATFEQALRTAVAAIFCAPDFIYLREPSGPLDDYALASRLAYFLTRTSPDAELLAAAARGELTRSPAALRAQTERLLNHPHHERFVTDFTDAWLNLREIEFTNPDEQLFPEFDPALQHAMMAETRAYWRKLVAENHRVVKLVKSDFAMLNERLARHYEIDGVLGPQMRAVPLPDASVRGGFLSQGAILKVSANGTNTSPVVRGVFVMERLLGQAPPPPPAGVPAVEPDIRGASTLRELLERHRSLESCRGCHQLIDPPGFALESFDPIGGWRDRFRSLGEGDKVSLEFNGQRVRYRLGPPVDAAGTTPDGRAFSGYVEFRDGLAQHPDMLARALATKLLTFATGREMGFSDRPVIEQIVQQVSDGGYGVRDLILATTASPVFQTK